MSRLSGDGDGVSLSKLTHLLSSALSIAGQCLLAVSSVKSDLKNMQYNISTYFLTLSTYFLTLSRYFFRRWQMLKTRHLDIVQLTAI